MLVGLVLGLAIYNAVLLDFPLPLALYRKLIGQSCTLRDLQDMEPTLGKNLNGLLQHEGQSAIQSCGNTWAYTLCAVRLPGPAVTRPADAHLVPISCIARMPLACFCVFFCCLQPIWMRS